MARILFLRDTDGSSYEFNETFRVEGLPFTVRVNNEAIAFSHGGIDVGDDKVSSRLISISGLIHDSDQDAHDVKVQAFLTAVMKKDQQLYWNTLKYINVKSLKKYSPKPVLGADGYVTEISIVLLCDDPFFYNVSTNSQFVALDGSPKTFNVTNPGGIEVFPLFGFTSQVDNVSFALANVTAGLCFSYVDAGFTAGKTISIDGQLGQADNSGVDSIRYFDGMFLTLLPGVNTLSYEGATLAGLSILFNERNL